MSCDDDSCPQGTPGRVGRPPRCSWPPDINAASVRLRFKKREERFSDRLLPEVSRESREIQSAGQVTMKNGRPATRGECGATMFRIGKAS